MNTVINRTGDILSYVAAGILFMLAGLTFCDVIGRRFFDAPIMGTIEIVELGMATAAFFAMPRAFLTNSHVSAQFIEHLAVGTFGAIIAFFRGSLMIGIIGLMAYATTIKAIELVYDNRVTIELEMPFYPFKLIIAAAMWCSAIAALAWTVRALKSGGPEK
jgi:TRAP-type C4-dicarboxylate transport system permease small subunit